MKACLCALATDGMTEIILQEHAPATLGRCGSPLSRCLLPTEPLPSTPNPYADVLTLSGISGCGALENRLGLGEVVLRKND